MRTRRWLMPAFLFILASLLTAQSASFSIFSPQIQTDGDLIVYTVRQTVGESINFISPQGGEPIQFTPPHTDIIDELPYWSPNGRQIAYERDRRLHLLTLSSGVNQPLEHRSTLQSNVTWTSDNTQIGTSSGVVNIQANTFTPWDDINVNLRALSDANLDWSPISDQLLYTSLDDETSYLLKMGDIRTSTLELLLPTGEGVNTCCAAWSPDSTRIALFRYAYDDADNANAELLMIDANRRQPRLLADGQLLSVYASLPLTWSPDGTHIAYLLQGPGNLADLYVVNLFGLSESRLLVSGVAWRSYGKRSYDWSPDGTQIAFIDADNDLAVINVDGSGQRVLVSRNVQHLDWRPAQLRIGDLAQVRVIDPDGLKMRGGPSIDNEIVAALADGATVRILDGPAVSPDGLVWWQVATADEETGWSVESADGIVTLLALPTALDIMLPTPIPSPTVPPTFLTPTLPAPPTFTPIPE